jgi:hydrogenase maturation protein HypF
MCDECCAELHDPADRRHRYPFINCTQCGPRYTLIESLPYDRENTCMSAFPLCESCRKEYEDPLDRRFHAEPVACPDCGPQVVLLADSGVGVTGDAALAAAVVRLERGEVIAVKGVGGYHLVCDARNDDAVAQLRSRKHRPDKPLAVMFPIRGDDGLGAVAEEAALGPTEASVLLSPMRPIVLVRKRATSALASGIAPGLRELGVFLPYAPLHQLLLAEFGAPLVATSGNISGEPVLTDNDEATSRLAGIADAFLHHDRPIVRPADDSVFRAVAGAVRPLRIGRGAAPRELTLPWRQATPVLAVGGHMKGTIAISWDDRVVVSPHIGEMDSPRSMAVFEQVANDLQQMYGVQAERVICDAHPGYATHRWAKNRSGLPVSLAWHHAAHASAVAAEFPGCDDWLIFTWDGVGLGEDGTLWGGEALLGRPGLWRRVGSMRPFHLPGGERAGREPWRSAAALAWACGRELPFDTDASGLAFAAWRKRLNCPETSAAGRIFDAASTMICGTTHVSFEAQGPMQLEALCKAEGDIVELPLETDESGLLRTDWSPLLDVLFDGSRSIQERAECFHTSMAVSLVRQALAIAAKYDVRRVGLAGGVFQNAVLTRQVVERLQANCFRAYLGELLPANDAALSFGQAAELAARDEIHG